ncbi:oxidoreductase [Streptomyces sp. NPDC006552]|uniref:oxidoreductase n=1 Tax=Streptomyces sp. NPDC006552 TaxID=3157179 RepID=UPI0033BEFB5B
MNDASAEDHDNDPPASLTPEEARVWQAFREGSACDLRTGQSGEDDLAIPVIGGRQRSVRAWVVERLLLDGPTALPGHVASLKLRGAEITGTLDLSGRTVAPYVQLVGCRFEQELRVSGARFTTLLLNGCSMPRLEGAGVHVEEALMLTQCDFRDGIRLTDARVGTDLLLYASQVSADKPGPCVAAAGIRVGRDLGADLMEARGEVHLHGATIGGSLSMRGCALQNLEVYGGLNAPRMTVGRTLDLSALKSGDRAHPGGLQAIPFRCFNGIRLDDGRFGAIDLESAQISLVGEQELSLRRVVAQELRYTRERQQYGDRVVLSDARVGNLADSAGSWPERGRLFLDGFVYDKLVPVDDFTVEQRLAWLAVATPAYLPQPYEQLAEAYRRGGHGRAVSQVRRTQRQRALLPWAARAWQVFRDAPGAAVALWAVAVVALLVVAWLSTRAFLAGTGGGGARLGPSDAPPAVLAVVSILSASGVLIGGVLGGLAKFVRARGQNTSDLVRAQAEMTRAEADMLRARAGLPSVEGPALPAAPGGEE